MQKRPPCENDFSGARETAAGIRRTEFPLVDIQTKEGGWVKAQKIQEEGDRITVRWSDKKAKQGYVVRTVFRETFEKWQTEAPSK